MSKKKSPEYKPREREAAIRKMYHFLTNNNSNHYWVFQPHRKPLFLEIDSPQELFRLVQMFSRYELEIAALAKWANTHKRAFKELTAEDYKSVQNLMAVQAVQDS